MAGSRQTHVARSPQRWLKGWRITSRLRLIVAAPLIAVFGFAGLALAANVTQARQAATLQQLTALGSEAGKLAYQLQRERGNAMAVLTVSPVTHLDAFVRQTTQTDTMVQVYSDLRRGLGTVPKRVTSPLRRIDEGLSGLSALRQQVKSAGQGSASAAAFSYRILIADLLGYRTAVAQAGLSADLADDIRAAAALSNAIEYASQQQIAVLRALAGGHLTKAMQQTVTTTRTGFSESSLEFLSLAQPTWRTWWDQASSGEAAMEAQLLQDRAARTAPGSRIGLDATRWQDSTERWFGVLVEVQVRVDAILVAKVASARTTAVRQASLNGGVMTLVVLLTILVTTAVARQITRQLHRLREAANTVAFDRLPAVVGELRTARTATIQPDEVARRSASTVRSAFALDRSGTDEISEVVQAFTEVHQAAVRTAAEQAIMRANTADIFVHLSRRGQRLVDSVLAQVDVVERDETDPDRLRQLYELDNLATRMSRANASLLVLGGVGVGRVRHEDVPLNKILQAALSQIQHYTRIRFGIIDPGVSVIAEAVDDIVHLFAELMDNATTYSPPESEAWVTARALGDRVIVQIGDEGVGLPPQRRAKLNELLLRPPTVDVAAIRSMGLVVVGHLAARFGARVELRPGPRLGTIAEIVLPSQVFRTTDCVEQPDRPGRGTPPAPISALPAGPPPTWPPALALDALPDGRACNHPQAGGGGHTDSLIDDDITAELPIFQQVNNWFHPDRSQRVDQQYQQPSTGVASPPGTGVARVPGAGRPPAPRSAPASLNGPPAAGVGPAGSIGSPAESIGSVEPARPGCEPAAGNGWPRIPRQPAQIIQPRQRACESWQTRSDEAWRAATALGTPSAASTTTAGLPQRVPQQHLVPQAPDPAEHQSRANHRDPTVVAAALSAYARGVAGRQLKPATAMPAIRKGSRS
ncbi:MAG: nitrate- and nitrite sensing domain-containing protein [Micromonosporaceae bacterium]|nr:nitrate- and nitrite sensing domain-containing protein [Micromonosporaceae bacterium]